MIPARILALLQGMLGPLQQTAQLFSLPSLRSADAHSQAYPVAPPAKSRRPRQTSQMIGVRRQHLPCPLMAQDQKLIGSPPAHPLCRAQSMDQRALHNGQQCLRGIPTV